ncbi:MAG: hypothetical protein ACRD3G_31785 [Vicinamibacterales bacterium]
MKPRHFRSLTLAAAALAVVAGSAWAQEKPSRLLNTLEVRELVARAEPADHTRLAVHFTALADRYATEANKHLSMAKSYVGNPNRNVGSGMSVHCRRLAELSTQEATTVRELATFHEKLAAGRPASPPRDSARFEGGAGAPAPTEKELNALAAKAGTPADHRALEEYFRTLAKRYTAEANDHVALAMTYRGTRIAQAAVIHDRLTGLARDAAKEATAAAEMHKQLATVGR